MYLLSCIVWGLWLHSKGTGTIPSGLKNRISETVARSSIRFLSFIILHINWRSLTCDVNYCASQAQPKLTDHRALKCVFKVTEEMLLANELITSGCHDSFFLKKLSWQQSKKRYDILITRNCIWGMKGPPLCWCDKFCFIQLVNHFLYSFIVVLFITRRRSAKTQFYAALRYIKHKILQNNH